MYVCVCVLIRPMIQFNSTNIIKSMLEMQRLKKKKESIPALK